MDNIVEPTGSPKRPRRGKPLDEAREDERAALTDVVESARRSFEELSEAVRMQVEQHPLRTVGLALVAGYVAGGGLFTRLTGRLVGTAFRLGLRMAALPIIRDEAFAVVEALGGRRDEQTRTGEMKP